MIESVDGRAARELPPGAVVEVRRSRYDALLVRIGKADFYRLVRSKFRLADPAATDSDAAGDLTLGTAPGSGWARRARIAGDVSRASHP